MKLMGL